MALMGKISTKQKEIQEICFLETEYILYKIVLLIMKITMYRI